MLNSKIDKAAICKRNLLKFQWSFFLLTIGARCNLLAIAWWALKETGSASLFSVIIACSIGSEVLIKPILGWTGDYFSKTKIVLLCNMLSLIGASSLLMLSLTDKFSPFLVTLTMMTLSLAVGVRDPIQSSIIPQLALPDEAGLAFNRKSLLSSIAMLLGPAIGGALVSLLGVSQALGVDFLMIALALGMVISMETSNSPNLSQVNKEKPPSSMNTPWYKLINSGFKIIYSVKTEFYLALFSMMINLFLFPFFTVIVPFYVQEIISLPAWYIGLLDCSFGIGILCASKLLIKMFSASVFRDRLIIIGFGFLGVNLLALGFSLPIYVLPIFFMLGGIGLILINVNTSTVRSLATPIDFRNRMGATASFISSLCSPIGSIIIGVSISHYGVQTTSQVTGTIIIALMLCIALIPNIRLFMRMSEEELNGAYGRIYPNAFQ